MTREEAKGFIQGKLDCMDRCDVFDCKGTDECENCNYCYSQGNFGEQKKAFEMAIEALEKQIPKKPNRHEEDIIGEYYSCPNCMNNELDDIFDNYCPRCGQALSWSEEGE